MIRTKQKFCVVEKGDVIFIFHICAQVVTASNSLEHARALCLDRRRRQIHGQTELFSYQICRGKVSSQFFKVERYGRLRVKASADKIGQDRFSRVGGALKQEKVLLRRVGNKKISDHLKNALRKQVIAVGHALQKCVKARMAVIFHVNCAQLIEHLVARRRRN